MNRLVTISLLLLLVVACHARKKTVMKGGERFGSFHSPVPSTGSFSFIVAIKKSKSQISLLLEVAELPAGDTLTIETRGKGGSRMVFSTFGGAIVSSKSEADIDGSKITFTTDKKKLFVYSSSDRVRFSAHYHAYYTAGKCRKEPLLGLAGVDNLPCDTPDFSPVALSCKYAKPCKENYQPSGESTCKRGFYWSVSDRCIPAAEQIATCSFDEDTNELSGCSYTLDEYIDYFIEASHDDDDDDDVKDDGVDVFELNTDRSSAGRKYKPVCGSKPLFCQTNDRRRYTVKCGYFLRNGRGRMARRRFAACLQCRLRGLCSRQKTLFG